MRPTTAATHAPADRPDLTRARLAATLVAGVALVVYIRTLLPALAFGDWGEMQTVPHILGIAHPTGYPTYILLAWLAELAPIGSVAYRANLLSAIFVALTLATCILICVRLGVRPSLAAVAALALGAVGTVWGAATVAEVNPLHLLLAALIIHRAIVWEDRRSPSDLALGGLLVGLSLGNHLLTLFIAPFVALFVLWAGRREFRARPALLLLPVAGLAVGLAVYLYIPIAASFSPALPYNHPVTWSGFVFLVTGEQFRGQFDFLSPHGPAEFIHYLPDLWQVLVARGTPVVPVVGSAGLLVLVVRRPASGLMCLAILVTGVYIWANYLRLEHYLLVPCLILAIGMAVALETVARTFEGGLGGLLAHVPVDSGDAYLVDRPRAGVFRLEGALVLTAGLAFAILLGGLNWSASDRSDDQSGTAYADAVLSNLPPNAAILVWWDAASPLWYARWVDGRRPDLLIVDDTNIVYEGWRTREARIATLICQRPVFIIRPGDPETTLTDAYQLDPVLTVPAAYGGPTAVTTRPIYRVTPLDPSTCGMP